ncbi:MAG: hypothetical protein ACI84C_002201 [Flavobacteriales bacterium]|jgi:hypothetical protein
MGENISEILMLLCIAILSSEGQPKTESLNHTTMKTHHLLLIAVACAFTFSSRAAVIYVDQDASGTNSGTSWANAYTDLQSALAAASSGDDIWVAEGVYKPTSTTDRDIQFEIDSGISLYGGFNGTELLRNERNWASNVTELSGAIGSPVDITDNSYNVIYALGTDIIVNGFGLKKAYRDFADPSYPQGAIYMALNTQMELKNCSIYNNSSSNGPAMSSSGEVNLTMINCLVRDNTTYYGGTINLNTNDLAKFYNCTFTQNEFEQSFGTVISGINSAYFIAFNDIFWDNDSHNPFGSPAGEFDQCILEVTSFSPGQIIGDYSTEDPLFEDPTSNNFQITSGSSAKDYGQNGLFNPGVDLAGNPRIWNIDIDAGCYEMQTDRQLYVDLTATGDNNGTNWNNAFTDLQDALGFTASSDQIWVADGVYKPTSTNDRSISFIIPEFCTLYGGFEGNETLLDSRDWLLHPTFISGNIGGPSEMDNSYRVLNILSAEVVSIDGFTISDGHADGSPPYDNSAGMYVSDTELNLSNCTVSDHYANFVGGCLFTSSSEVNIDNCVFQDISADATTVILSQTGSMLTVTNTSVINNTSDGSGGGIAAGGQFSFTNVLFSGNTAGYSGVALSLNFGSVGSVNKCTFSNNTSTILGGIVSVVSSDVQFYNSIFQNNVGGALTGALDIYSGDCKVESCLFYQNSSTNNAAMRITPLATAEILNCTFTENTTSSGSGTNIKLDGTGGAFSNCIVWNNSAVNSIEIGAGNSNPSYSIIQGGSAGTFIIDSDPNFINPLTHDFQITTNSPAYNTGLNSASTYATDLAGNQRISLLDVDMGCYEVQTCAAPHDECENYFALLVDEEPKFGSNECASSGSDAISNCTVSTGRTVWYGFTAPASGSAQVITSDVTLIAVLFNMRITAFSGDCGALNQIACSDENVDNSAETLDLSGLIPGTTYFVRIDGVGTQTASFKIQIIETTTSCPGDFNGDFIRDTTDLLQLLSQFGCQSDCFADLNNDDIVDTIDILTFLSLFGTSCV